MPLPSAPAAPTRAHPLVAARGPQLNRPPEDGSTDAACPWDERAAHFDDWGPPLRPPPGDVALYGELLARHLARRAERPDALGSGASSEIGVRRFRHPAVMLGVTPELALAPWAHRLDLTAIDQSPAMVRRVWPGDVPGLRRAIVGDWMQPWPLPGTSARGSGRRAAVVMTDGARVFFGDPAPLLDRIVEALDDDGLLLIRVFCAPAEPASLPQVLAALEAGAFDTFHRFKWHVATALQPDARTGVSQQAVRCAIEGLGVDWSRHPQPGFGPRAVGTLRFYADSARTLHFPTREAAQAELAERFHCVERLDGGGWDAQRFTVFAASIPRR